MASLVKYTIAQLDDAIRYVSGNDPSLTIRSTVRVLAHHRACFEAFLLELTGPEIDILRRAARDLAHHGSYQPWDSVWPAE